MLVAQNICKAFYCECDYNGEKCKVNIKVLYIVIPFGNVNVVFVFKLCKLRTMNPVEEGKKNNFLVQPNKKNVNFVKRTKNN